MTNSDGADLDRLPPDLSWTADPPIGGVAPGERGKGLMRVLVAVVVLVTMFWAAILLLG